MFRARSTIALLCVAVASAGCDRTDPTTAPRFTPNASALLAGTFTVTNTNDDGAGSLRAALAAAEAQGGGTIGFAAGIAGQTIVLASELVVGSQPVAIEGPAANGVTLSGGGLTRVVRAASGATLTLRNLTVANGFTTVFGAGMYVEAGATVTLDHVTVSGNTVVNPSAVSGDGGGVITGAGSTLTVVNSTFSGNSANGYGGAVFGTGTVTIISSTITGNTGGDGGGIVAGSGATLLVRNSILAKNTGGNCDFAGGISTLAGKNVVDVAGDCTGPSVILADPMLGPLAANGGPTRTHALLTGSPAIDAAIECGVTTDQRYVDRPQGTGCDIGAFEYNDYSRVALTVDASVLVNPNTGVAIVTGITTCSKPATILLAASLTQTQKTGRSTTVAQATGTTLVSCTATTVWSISLAPPTGAFQNGTGSVTVSTSSTTPATTTPAPKTTAVKMSWAHK
jgi:predicted outer membrane repeat protein